MGSKKRTFFTLLIIIVVLLIIQNFVREILSKNMTKYSEYVTFKKEIEILESNKSKIKNQSEEIKNALINLRKLKFLLRDSTETMELLNHYLHNSNITVDSLNENSFQEFKMYNVSVLNIKLIGSYEEVFKFLQKIENEEIFLEIK
ncbi:hypothetical protein KAU33_02660, partial [Candidatus Dependentiae bacterium]|nr:hypothetical protein [Candidatus Dependentiae bacterium]